MPEQGTFFGECSHAKTVFAPTPGGPHHGKAVCLNCGKFMGWVKKPETIEREKKNAEILTALSLLKDLPPWERHFVRQLSTQRHLSPKQQEKLLQIRDIHLGKEERP